MAGELLGDADFGARVEQVADEDPAHVVWAEQRVVFDIELGFIAPSDRFWNRREAQCEMPRRGAIVGLNAFLHVLVASGSTAVLVDFLCVTPVVRRKRAADAGDMSRVDAESRWILRAFWTGAPAASIAFFSAAVIRGGV
jgi:hypothetical protein